MIDRLPYALSKGVTAMREGLELTDTWELLGWLFEEDAEYCDLNFIPWFNAAERLRYRKDEPWCLVWHERRQKANPDIIACASPEDSVSDAENACLLHRLAAILCDDAEAFRVLHWCVHNLAESKKNNATQQFNR